MKKVFLGMLLIALSFGTMSLTTNSKNVIKTSTENQNTVEVRSVVFGATYTCAWNSCCESPLIPIERDIVQRGLPAGTIYTIISTTTNSVTYKVY
ncbi:hypothetical protein L1276_001355 [Flavobacterium sp. HSC-32F16]|uniref:hypothetical protein n=1 Tax=Flavobacterium sp. HSC-32F16 TaxID=2910964 RepID=UPI0020A36DB3|nr:hypothetical protein [Flavobacterium sp. HSC-32F16]MCP2026211.1 hypothetical protein [Flavobacterium sp. HSC-32F16]